MSDAQTHRRGSFPALAVLAGVLGALVAFQALAQLASSSGARSGMVSQVSGYSIMTSDAGNEDVILVLDNRNEELMAYRAENQSIQLYQKVSLPRIFTDARARNQGRN